jgi:hypothetical protein
MGCLSHGLGQSGRLVDEGGGGEVEVGGELEEEGRRRPVGWVRRRRMRRSARKKTMGVVGYPNCTTGRAIGRPM